MHDTFLCPCGDERKKSSISDSFWDKSWAPPLFILIWFLLFLWDCGTSSRQSYLPRCILFTPFPGGAVITAGKQVPEPQEAVGVVPPGTVQGMHRSALLSSSDEQWQACKLIVWITGTARAAVTRFTGQICHERASVSSLTDAWVWTAASSGRKKPTNLSSPVVPSAGKEPMSAWGKGRKRPHYLDSQLWFSTGWTCTTWVGSWRLQKTLGALAEYGKAAIVLKSLPVPGNAG